jgi:NAD(P)-dependent dehydrogenase (short-subunit alcohol dehydrogenase family)
MSPIALVTGSNRGIGLEVCRQLAQQGITTLLTSRNPSQGQAAADSLRQQGLPIHYHPLDVADPKTIHTLHRHILDQFGRLDILINNAALYLDEGVSVLHVPFDTVRTTIETNLYGPLLLCQTFIPLMRQHNYGRIVNVSSMMGALDGMGGRTAAYRLSKAALNALTLILAAELGRTNIKVNAVCPGWVKTGMGGPGAPRTVQQGADTILWLATLPDNGPTGRFFRDRRPIPW